MKDKTFHQCTFCDIRSKNPDDPKFDTCKQNRHQIVKMLSQREVKSGTKEESKKSIKKVKGMIGPYFVESIVVEGLPTFLCYNFTQDKLQLLEEIEYLDKIYKPKEAIEVPYYPYNYTHNEITNLISNPPNKEQLLDEIKKIIDYFLYMPERDRYLTLGDVMISYSQEWINLLHYIFFVGETESGKSSGLHLLRWLAYRCLYSEDIPDADIYNFLDIDEEGAGTIAEDEAQDLSTYKSKIRTYKNSYSKGSTKPRILGVDSQQKKQVYYKTFCFKAFAGERVPDDKGFRERLAIIHMTQGQTKGNIKNPSADEKAHLQSLRNKLLFWKVQNIKKGLDKINSDLTQRDQELWEDYLSVASNTKYLEHFKNVVAYYINQRHEAIWNSLESKLFKILIKNCDLENKISLEKYWFVLTETQDILPGTVEKQTFYPSEFGTKVTRNYISNIFEDKFQAKKRAIYATDEDGKKHLTTFYVFDLEVLTKLCSKYNVDLETSISSGRSGGSGQLTLEVDHVDHVDNLNEIPSISGEN